MKQPFAGVCAFNRTTLPPGYTAETEGVTVYLPWKDLEAANMGGTLNGPGLATITSVIANATAGSWAWRIRLYTNGPIPGASGVGYPGWMTSVGVPTFRHLNSQENPATDPAHVFLAYWHPTFKTYYQRFITALGALVDGEATLREVCIGGAMFLYAEPFILDPNYDANVSELIGSAYNGGVPGWGTGTPANAGQLAVAGHGAGFTDAAYQAALGDFFDMHATAFPTTPQALAFNPYQTIDSTTGTVTWEAANAAKTKTIGELFITKLGAARAVLSNTSIGPNRANWSGGVPVSLKADAYGAMYGWMRSKVVAGQAASVFLQTQNTVVILNPVTPPFTTLPLAMDAANKVATQLVACSGSEPQPNTFTPYSQAMVSGWNDALLANAPPVPPPGCIPFCDWYTQCTGGITPPPDPHATVRTLVPGTLARTATMQVRSMWNTGDGGTEATRIAKECVFISANIPPGGVPYMAQMMAANPDLYFASYEKNWAYPVSQDTGGTKFPAAWYAKYQQGGKAQQQGSFTNWLMEQGGNPEARASKIVDGVTETAYGPWHLKQILAAYAVIEANVAGNPMRAMWFDTAGTFCADNAPHFWDATTGGDPGWNPHTNAPYGAAPVQNGVYQTKQALLDMIWWKGDLARNHVAAWPAINPGNLWVAANGLNGAGVVTPPPPPPPGAYAGMYGGDTGGGYVESFAADPQTPGQYIVGADTWGMRVTTTHGNEWFGCMAGVANGNRQHARMSFYSKRAATTGLRFFGTGTNSGGGALCYGLPGSLALVTFDSATSFTLGLSSNQGPNSFGRRACGQLMDSWVSPGDVEYLFTLNRSGVKMFVNGSTAATLSARAAAIQKPAAPLCDTSEIGNKMRQFIEVLDAQHLVVINSDHSITSTGTAGGPQPTDVYLVTTTAASWISATPANTTAQLLSITPPQGRVYEIHRGKDGVLYAAAGYDGGYRCVFTGSDFTWTKITSTLVDDLCCSVDATSTGTVWFGQDGTDGSYGNSSTGMVAGHAIIKVTSGGAVSYGAPSTNVGFAEYDRGDGATATGRLWWIRAKNIVLNDQAYDCSMIRVDPFDDQRVISTGRAGQWQTRDGGAHWNPAVRGMNGGQTISGANPAPTGPAIRCTGGTSVMFYNDDYLGGTSADAMSTCTEISLFQNGTGGGILRNKTTPTTYVGITGASYVFTPATSGNPATLTKNGAAIHDAAFQGAVVMADSITETTDGSVMIIQDGGGTFIMRPNPSPYTVGVPADIAAHYDMVMCEGWIHTYGTWLAGDQASAEQALQLAVTTQLQYGTVFQAYDWAQGGYTAAQYTQRRRAAAAANLIAQRTGVGCTFEFANTKTDTPGVETMRDPDLFAVSLGAPLVEPATVAAAYPAGHRVPAGAAAGQAATAGLLTQRFDAGTVIWNPTGSAITYHADRDLVLVASLEAPATPSYAAGAAVSIPAQSGVIFTTTGSVTPVAPVNVSPPNVSGSLVVGSTLTTSSGTWSGSVPMTPDYQWQVSADGVTGWSGVGANQATYATTGQLGKYVRCGVRESNTAGQSPRVWSNVVGPIVAAQAPPAWGIPGPSISGPAVEEGTLTANLGTTTGNPPPTASYAWSSSPTGLANTWTPLPGETAATLALPLGSAGTWRQVTITLTNGVSPDAVRRVNMGPISPLGAGTPPNVTQPPYVQLIGVAAPTVGIRVRAVLDGVDGTPPFAYTYQWDICDANGASRTPIIPAATGEYYTPVASQVGLTLRVEMTVSNAYGTYSGLVSPASPRVVAAPVPPRVAPISQSLGCGLYDVMIHSRGGATIRHQLAQWTTLRWTRSLGSPGSAEVDLSGLSASDFARCCAELEDVLPWADELALYRRRDGSLVGDLVWTGPIGDPELDTGKAVIPASDLLSWLDVRFVHHDYAWTDADLADIAASIIQDALAPDPSPMITLVENPAGVTGSITVLESDYATAGEKLRSLVDQGLRISCIRRTVTVGGHAEAEYVFADSAFATPPQIRLVGSGQVTRAAVTGQASSVGSDTEAIPPPGIATASSDDVATYGLIERSMQTDATTPDAVQGNADRWVAAAAKPIGVVEQGVLSQSVGLTVADLVPGRRVRVRLTDQCYQVDGQYELSLVEAEAAAGTERITVHFTPVKDA